MGAGHDELAKKLANPLAAMISVPFQNNFDFNGGPNGDGFQWKMNVQPVMPYYVDIGGGSSDLTWQAAAGIGYHLNECWDLALMYRYLDFDLDGAVLNDLNVRGPQIGARFKF